MTEKSTPSSTTEKQKSPPSGYRRWFKQRFGSLLVFALIFLALSVALRVTLLLQVAHQADWSPVSLVKTFAMGFVFDLAMLSFLAGPVALLYIVLPDRFFHWKAHRVTAMIVLILSIYLILFDLAAEWFFWEEFTARFNFVAVDYLVYTNEVVGNIVESYPLWWILGGIAVITTGMFLLVWPTAKLAFQTPSTFRQRLKRGWFVVVAPVVFLLVLDISDSQITDNRLNNELAKNGLYSLIAAFRNNVIAYKDFYTSMPDEEALLRLRTLLQSPGEKFVTDQPTDIRRDVTAKGPEKRYNVVILVVESLSARFLGSFGNATNCTPNLDALAEESMFFTNFYATGTRTTRGLEAIALSLPPTPGRSLVKRPNNANLFSLGQIFQKRGYDTVFLYGGYGYFDNMNAFFAGNGFRTVDRADLQKDEITFTNAWGVCDEDLFARVLKECDKSYAEGKPFLDLVMTTSNHRPYSFPEGKIDLKQGNRNAAVKYTDYAIGTFLKSAKTKPWFDNTVFVIVADHCANSAGKVDVEVKKYHIPLFLYAPKILPPQRVKSLAGQIDIPPTLLGVLNFNYRSKFFGQNVLAGGEGRVLLGNYQKVGLFQKHNLTLLLPRNRTEAFSLDHEGQHPAATTPERIADAVSYYQTADYLLSHEMQNAE